MTDIDELMAKIDEYIALGKLDELPDTDIDTIIAYQRKTRALRESGVKVKKGDTGAPKKKLTLAMLGIEAKSDTKFLRRV